LWVRACKLAPLQFARRGHRPIGGANLPATSVPAPSPSLPFGAPSAPRPVYLAGLALRARIRLRGAAGQHPSAWALTNRPSRRRFAARLNSGVRRQLCCIAAGVVQWRLTLGRVSC
jgi:hypothetical protein